MYQKEALHNSNHMEGFGRETNSNREDTLSHICKGCGRKVEIGGKRNGICDGLGSLW